jgi:heme-degrading monooxygenase HmoA
MVIRQWRGLAKRDQVSRYAEHFRSEVLTTLRGLAGFRGATLLRRDTGEGVELTVLSRWDSMEAVGAFTGLDIDRAVVAQAAQPCFHSYEETVTHHEVVADENA